jgi:hypothetical protein
MGTVSAEASTTAAGRGCPAAGFGASCLAGSAIAGLANAKTAPIAIAQARMASSITCADSRKTSFRCGLAKWLKGLGDFADNNVMGRKTAVFSTI